MLFKRQCVKLNEDLDFPPYGATHFAVPVNVKPGTLLTFDADPKLLHDTSIRAAGTLDCVSPGGLVMVNLVNSTMFPITLKRGTYLGDLNPTLHAEAVNSISTSTPINPKVKTDADLLSQFTFDLSLSQKQINELQRILLEFRSLFRDKIDNVNIIQTKVRKCSLSPIPMVQ